MGNKAWSILFGVVMLGCLIGFAISPLMGWWLPEGVSSHADNIDFLFNVILWITTFFFILTEGILVVFLWQYASNNEGKRPVLTDAAHPGYLTPLTNILHDQHRIELAWTFVPAVILLYIAFAQIHTWADVKYESRRQGQESKTASLQIGVSARQFEWRMRYPSVARFEKWTKDKEGTRADAASFGKIPQPDDIYLVNELHAWDKQQVVVHLSTRDVIHSFNLPNFRVKQDALPGKMIPVWFTPIKANCRWDASKERYVDGVNPASGKEDRDFIWDIPCAELCGWGHYRMIGRVFIHKDQDEFMNWLRLAEKNSHRHESDR